MAICDHYRIGRAPFCLPHLGSPRCERRCAMLEHPRINTPQKSRQFTNLYKIGPLRVMEFMAVNKS